MTTYQLVMTTQTSNDRWNTKNSKVRIVTGVTAHVHNKTHKLVQTFNLNPKSVGIESWVLLWLEIAYIFIRRNFTLCVKFSYFVPTITGQRNRFMINLLAAAIYRNAL